MPALPAGSSGQLAGRQRGVALGACGQRALSALCLWLFPKVTLQRNEHAVRCRGAKGSRGNGRFHGTEPFLTLDPHVDPALW